MIRIVLLTVLTALVILATACATEMPNVGGAGQPSGGSNSAPTEVFTPIALAATPTPPPPPPTPTPRPKPTDAPTLVPEPTKPDATAVPTQAPQAGVDTPMMDIAAGSFQMGSDAGTADSKPPHKVQVAAFSLDEFEVTNADFKKFVDATGYKTDAEKQGDKDWTKFAQDKDSHPVVKVSWNDATAFCTWAGKRLPTEVEWEYAARGADSFAYPYGNEFDANKQNGKESGIRSTTAVGSYPASASPFKVQDMAGNVWEWTGSHPEHYPGNTTNSKLYGASLYILRGGGWFDTADLLTTFYRNSGTAETAQDVIGFRCAK